MRYHLSTLFALTALVAFLVAVGIHSQPSPPDGAERPAFGSDSDSKVWVDFLRLKEKWYSDRWQGIYCNEKSRMNQLFSELGVAEFVIEEQENGTWHVRCYDKDGKAKRPPQLIERTAETKTWKVI
jgi:hypothetical protein